MASDPQPGSINFTLNGKPLGARPGETILQAAKRVGIEIPHLCYKEGLRA
ncbi:MAG: 2Fe-2S iron-sulfur cluster binding domain-containing protein, partial [gamma proteobacterium symbiont of Ctena orbiculata]